MLQSCTAQLSYMFDFPTLFPSPKHLCSIFGSLIFYLESDLPPLCKYLNSAHQYIRVIYSICLIVSFTRYIRYIRYIRSVTNIHFFKLTRLPPCPRASVLQWHPASILVSTVSINVGFKRIFDEKKDFQLDLNFYQRLIGELRFEINLCQNEEKKHILKFYKYHCEMIREKNI